jgi:hypothetical protein
MSNSKYGNDYIDTIREVGRRSPNYGYGGSLKIGGRVQITN